MQIKCINKVLLQNTDTYRTAMTADKQVCYAKYIIDLQFIKWKIITSYLNNVALENDVVKHKKLKNMCRI